jgi:hypothetical protein
MRALRAAAGALCGYGGAPVEGGRMSGVFATDAQGM